MSGDVWTEILKDREVQREEKTRIEQVMDELAAADAAACEGDQIGAALNGNRAITLALLAVIEELKSVRYEVGALRQVMNAQES